MRYTYGYVVMYIKDKDGNTILSEATEISDRTARYIEDEAARLVSSNRKTLKNYPDSTIEFNYIDRYKNSWRCIWDKFQVD